jgi:hypothetical protein
MGAQGDFAKKVQGSDMGSYRLGQDLLFYSEADGQTQEGFK